MTLYRICFELCSPIVTPLKGDTIWGHVVWGIANHEGDQGVAAFLEAEKKDPPAFVVSSAFPSGMLCRALPVPQERKDDLNIQKYSEIKKDKKIIYMAASEYVSETKTEPADPQLKSVQSMHNTIDRGTNTVLEGGLFATEERWYSIFDGNAYKKVDWDVYILSYLDKTKIAQLMEWAFENGYGDDASVGKGKIRIKSDPVPVTVKKKGHIYMSLGPFVSNPNHQLMDIRGTVFIRNGKLGGVFAAGLSPYKKTVILYDEGTVFSCAEPLFYTGSLLSDMHGEDDRICQSGFAPVIPVD